MRWCAAVAVLGGCAGGPSPVAVIDQSASHAREIDLGRTLFFDVRLSADGSRSCATCHQPSRAFSDGLAFSMGLNGQLLKRHTPHLLNLAGGKTFFWDGRVTSLEEQAVAVLASEVEMNLPVALAAPKLASVPYYAEGFAQVYPTKGLTSATLPRALAAYVRSLVSADAPFDRFRRGDSTALTSEARLGFAIFRGKGGCTKCHSGAELTDFGFHNTGVAGTDRGRAALDRVGEFRNKPYPFFQTQRAFKTPSLRNVAETAPYFHNGSEATLRDVVLFYNQGGKEVLATATSSEVHPLSLNDREVDAVVAFLRSLSGPLAYEGAVVPQDSSRYRQPVVAGRGR